MSSKTTCSSGLSKTDKLDLLIALQQETQRIIQDQAKQIEELKKENREILQSTAKMAKHIDFINNTYEKVSGSYFFRNMLWGTPPHPQ